MKLFFNYIKARIETIEPNPGEPAFKAVRLWNNQFQKSNVDRKEKAIPYPACFVEFIVNSVNNYALGIKDYFLTVRFRFGVEGYKFERLETFDFCDQFHAAIHMMRPTDESELIFTSFQEVTTDFDEDHNNVEIPYIDYRTRYRSVVAHGTYIETESATALDLDTELIETEDELG